MRLRYVTRFCIYLFTKLPGYPLTSFELFTKFSEFQYQTNLSMPKMNIPAVYYLFVKHGRHTTASFGTILLKAEGRYKCCFINKNHIYLIMFSLLSPYDQLPSVKCIGQSILKATNLSWITFTYHNLLHTSYLVPTFYFKKTEV